MSIFLCVAAFLFVYIIVWSVENNQIAYDKEKTYLAAACFVLTLLIGFRHNWPDEVVYVEAFRRSPLFYEFNWSTVVPFGYVEKGYLYLASIIKTVWDNSTVYLLTMGGISMYLLYKSLDRYCIFPLLGLCDYMGRFMLNRDFTQMRSSLAILMIIYAIHFIQERKLVPYMLVILLAYQFHHMALLGVPLYFLYKIPLGRKSLIAGLVLAFVFSQTLAGSIEGFVDQYSEDLQYTTYTQGSYTEEALGLRNPMIYFQIAILLLFSHYEESLRQELEYFDLYRWAYFYSTLFLIVFCNYTALSGRTSTMFATVEMFMLPFIIHQLKGWKRNAFMMMLGVVFTYFFWNKLMNAYMMSGGTIF